MDISEALPSIAEVAVTLVGFAAVFRAFRGVSVDAVFFAPVPSPSRQAERSRQWEGTRKRLVGPPLGVERFRAVA